MKPEVIFLGGEYDEDNDVFTKCNSNYSDRSSTGFIVEVTLFTN